MSHLNKKTLGAGAALVALSAFVPNINITDKIPNLGLVSEAHAQATAKATLDVNAKVINPLGVSQLLKIDFEDFAIGGAGNVKVAADGATTYVNATKIVQALPGEIKVTAPQNVTFSVSVNGIAAPGILLKNGAGGAATKTMTMKTLFLSANAANMAANVGEIKATAAKVAGFKITDTAGTGVIDIGGNLHFDAIQVAGDYVGTYVILLSL